MVRFHMLIVVALCCCEPDLAAISLDVRWWNLLGLCDQAWPGVLMGMISLLDHDIDALVGFAFEDSVVELGITIVIRLQVEQVIAEILLAVTHQVSMLGVLDFHVL